jgi:hypothetical protein
VRKYFRVRLITVVGPIYPSLILTSSLGYTGSTRHSHFPQDIDWSLSPFLVNMAFGILEDHKTPMPLGTVALNDIFAQSVSPDDPNYVLLKKDGHIILQPQPSDSVNDPLNWTQKHKYWLCCLLMITMVTVGATTGMITTGYRQLAEQFHVDYPTVVASFTPPYLAAHAVSLFLSSATCAVYGKRILYVHAIVVLWFAMLAGYWANSLRYYTIVNSISGFAAAPMELLLAPMLTDTIFIHQRGRLMALSGLVTVIGGDLRYVTHPTNA